LLNDGLLSWQKLRIRRSKSGKLSSSVASIPQQAHGLITQRTQPLDVLP
jgi:hypothetical protein